MAARIALAIALVAGLLMPSPALAGPSDQRLDLYWIDVEGGASTLLVTPAGETVLIDTGNPGRRDAGRNCRSNSSAAKSSSSTHRLRRPITPPCAHRPARRTATARTTRTVSSWSSALAAGGFMTRAI